MSKIATAVAHRSKSLARTTVVYSANRFSSLRRTALSLLKNNHRRKVGIKNKRLIAGWDESHLTEVLLGK